MVGFVGLWMLFAIVQIPLKIFNAGLNIMAVAYLFVLAVLIAAGCVFADKKRLRHLLEKIYGLNDRMLVHMRLWRL